jgi:glycosyltransferase involved in cell wall biosynthesis
VTDNRPLVSVVLPTYDRPRRLREAVDSVTDQTYGPIELVVVDDASPTPAREVLPDTLNRDVRLRHVCHTENRGANAARNTGIKAATGELVSFLDDDDRMAPEKLERQVRVYQDADPAVGVVYTGTRYVNPSGVEQFARTPTTRGDVTRDILTGEPVGEFPTAMVDPATIEQAGLPDERFPSWQDREWFLRLSRHCEFEPVPEPLSIRRMGYDDQIHQNFETKRDVSYPLFVEKHRPLAAEYGPLVERRFMSSLARMLGMAAVSTGHYAEARRYLLRAIRHYPAETDAYPYLIASLGGKYTYRTGKWLRHLLRAVTVDN